MRLLQKNLGFRSLFITQFLGALNDNIMRSALIIYFTFVLAQKENIPPAILTNLALALFILPFFLFSSIAGELGDARDKAKLTRIIKVWELGIVVVAVYAFTIENIVLLYLTLFLMGCQSAFFGPIKYSILTQLVTKKDLLLSNSFIEAFTFIAILLGTLLGSHLISITYNITWISLVLISIAVLGIVAAWQIPKQHVSLKISQKRIPIRSMFHQIQFIDFAFHYSAPIKQLPKKLVWHLCLAISWFWLIGALYLAQLPVWVEQSLHAQPAIANLFLLIFTLGLSTGAFLSKRLVKKSTKITHSLTLVPGSCLGIGIFSILIWPATLMYNQIVPSQNFTSLFAFISLPIVGLLILIIFVVTVCAGIYIVPLYTELISVVKQHDCSKIIAANNICNAFFMVCGSISALVLAKLGFSTDQILFLIVGIMSLIAWPLMKKFFSFKKGTHICR